MNWKKQIENSYTKIEDLPHHHFTEKDKNKLSMIIKRHPMRITPYYYSLIDPADPFDPIRKLAIPDFDELSREGTYDSSGEAANTVFDGLQHKYAATVFITEQ